MVNFWGSVGVAIRDIFSDAWAVFCGLSASILGYFLPVKNYLLLLLLFFIADVAFGYWAARRIRKEKFSTKIIWDKTVPRMVISVFLVLATFMWDDIYGQDMVSTCAVVGWFFCGVLLMSITKNGYLITKWDVLPKFEKYIGKRIDQKTDTEERHYRPYNREYEQ